MATEPTLVSGFRPTGRLHLGHLHGTLKNWVKLQESYRSFFVVADWLAVGLDPKRSVVFRQSAVLEHAELFLIFGMITPTPWLLRNPTVKEQARELGLVGSDDEAEMAKINFGHLGYPVLQAADILVYKASHVPVGADCRTWSSRARSRAVSTISIGRFFPSRPRCSPRRRRSPGSTGGR